MQWKSLILLLLHLNYFPRSSIADPTTCVGLETCATCIQNPDCAWCSQSDFHGSDKKQLPRCNSIEVHKQLGRFQCMEQHLFNHSNNLLIIREEQYGDERKAAPISPQQLSIKLRVGDPVSFRMRYKEVEDYPLDLYYLMDGTYTMLDDKQVLENLGDELGKRLRVLTSKFRIGFGTFVDKVTSPFISTIPSLLENPCSVRGDTCVRPYGFKNHMRLSNDTRRFSGAVKNVVLSASTDIPEGGFDALMQTMVCESQIGWSEHARRLILFATDATFHYAGDGRLGGLILPNDGNCHLDENGEYYTHSLMSDYPSMSQINLKAKRHSINIIFAVTADSLPDYELLADVVEGSKTTELAKNSSNIVDLVEQQYKTIKSKVEIKDSFPSEFFNVKYYSSCNDGFEAERSTCEGLQSGTEVRFRVEIELIKCSPRKAEWKQQYRIYAVGVPDGVDVDVEMLCDCPCEDEKNKIPNSPLCGGKGDEICGLCECHENYFGKICECSSTGRRIDEKRACMQDNSTKICNERGTCNCGICVCSDPQRYSGTFCECDNANCLLKDGMLCAGHGDCDCGTCKCYPGWAGAGCDCSTKSETCYEPGSEIACNGKGNCVCGACQCTEKYYTGAHCEKCFHESCPNKCDQLKDCVQCKIHGNGIYNPSDCELNCYEHSITPVEVVTADPSGKTEEVICKHEDPSDECVFIFSYQQTKDKKFVIKAQSTKECPPEAPIFWIIAITSSIVVLIGLILLCVYKAYQKIQVKREYAAYLRDGQKSVWKEENPIYSNPVGTFENPLYAGKQ